MQNKPNFGKAQMNVNIYNIKEYQIFILLAGQKNKPNSNPIKPNLRKAKMNAYSCATTDYENKWQRRVRKNKPKQTQFPKVQNELKIACRKIRPHPLREDICKKVES